MAETNEIKKLVDAAHHVPDLYTLPDGRKFVVRPNGPDSFALDQITLPNAAEVLQPKTVVQAVAVQTAGSLKTYVNRFKNDDTVLFADIDNNVVVGVIDYHKQPTMLIDTEGKPASAQAISETPEARLGTHSATLKLPFSKEWATWTSHNERLMEHVAFCDFLEENLFDIVGGIAILESCREFQVKSDVHFASAVRFGDKIKFAYSKGEDAVTKNEMEFPAEFELDLPVYFAETNVNVRCLMRRKIAQGELHLGYKMIRVENIRQHEFNRIVSNLQFDTSVTAVYGRRS